VEILQFYIQLVIGAAVLDHLPIEASKVTPSTDNHPQLMRH
jgi:hypothetical protein